LQFSVFWPHPPQDNLQILLIAPFEHMDFIIGQAGFSSAQTSAGPGASTTHAPTKIQLVQ
jgi:hypothetical protein